MARTWNAVAGTARLLPRKGDATRVEPVRGVADQAVMIELAGSPAVFARMARPPVRNSYLRVALGRMTFDVCDAGAYSSAMMAFRRAEELAATTFLPTRAVSAREQAALNAGRLFVACRGTHRPGRLQRGWAPVAAHKIRVAGRELREA